MNNQMDEGVRSALKKVGAKVKHKWKMATDDVYKDVDKAKLRPGQKNNPQPKGTNEEAINELIGTALSLAGGAIGGALHGAGKIVGGAAKGVGKGTKGVAKGAGNVAAAPIHGVKKVKKAVDGEEEEAEKQQQLAAHTEYKRLGYVINEILGALTTGALGGVGAMGAQKVLGKSEKKKALEKRKAALAAKEEMPGVEEGVGSKLYKGTKETARVAGLVPGAGIVGDAVAGGMTAAQLAVTKDKEKRSSLKKELAGDALAAIPGAGLGTRGAQYAAKGAKVAGKAVKGGKGAGKMRSRAGAAVRMHGTKAAQAGGEALEQKAREKSQELRQQEEGRQTRIKYMQALKEAHQAHVDPESKKEIAKGDPAGGYAGPLGRRYGKKRTSKGIRDPLVKRHAQGAKRRLDKKLGVKTNPRAQDMVQAAMLHKRKTETPGLGRERPQDARADAREDKRRKMAPGDK